MIIPFIIAYFTTGLLFTFILLLAALFIYKVVPKEMINEWLDQYWAEIICDYGEDDIKKAKYLGQSFTRENFVRLTLILWCFDMFLCWPNEIYKICMKKPLFGKHRRK